MKPFIILLVGALSLKALAIPFDGKKPPLYRTNSQANI